VQSSKPPVTLHTEDDAPTVSVGEPPGARLSNVHWVLWPKCPTFALAHIQDKAVRIHIPHGFSPTLDRALATSHGLQQSR
jgi:hypothetical protein